MHCNSASHSTSTACGNLVTRCTQDRRTYVRVLFGVGEEERESNIQATAVVQEERIVEIAVISQSVCP